MCWMRDVQLLLPVKTEALNPTAFLRLPVPDLSVILWCWVVHAWEHFSFVFYNPLKVKVSTLSCATQGQEPNLLFI